MPGEFRLTGSASQLIADGTDFGTAEDLAALAGIVIKFTSNIPINKAVPIPGGVMYVPPRTATVLDDGQISEDGVNPGITLLADDPALELTAPLQWTIDPGRAILAGKTVKLAKWTFNAPAPADDQTLDELTPVPGITQPGGTRGPRGYPVDDVELVSGTGALSLSLSTVGDAVTATVTTTGEDTIQFSAHSLPVGDPLPVLVAGVGPRIVVDPMQYSAVGDGAADDTTALQNALADLVGGGELRLPYGKTFKYTDELVIPYGATIVGPGRNAAHPALLAGAAGAQITFGIAGTGDSMQQLRDLNIDGNNLGKIGVYIPISNRPSMNSVRINEFTQAGVVLDGAQNGDFSGVSVYGCGTAATPSGWPAVGNWLWINGCNNNYFLNCAGSGNYTQTNANYRSIIMTNIFTDPRFTGEVFGPGNGENTWFGGIMEGATVADHKVEITAGATSWPTWFYRASMVGPTNNALVKVSGYDALVVFEDCTFTSNTSSQVVAEASTGQIVYRGTTKTGPDDHRGLREATTLTGTASVIFDEHCRQLLTNTNRRFDSGIGDWLAIGGTAVWHSGTKSLSITGSGSINSGAYNYLQGPGGNAALNNYSAAGRLVRVRCYLSSKVGGWKLTSLLNGGSGFLDTGITLAAGYNDVIYEMAGPSGGVWEVGLCILQSATETASCKVRFIDIEHIAG